MGFLDKVKNMFIEELDDEDVIKKEVIQVKIPRPEVQKESKNEVKQQVKTENVSKPIPKPVPKVFDDYVDEDEEIPVTKEVEHVPEEVAPKANLPKYFDDSDFEMIDKQAPVEPVIVKQEYKYTKTETVVAPVISGYNGKKNEDAKKVFQPTPIISPVYGVLDKNYRKDEISAKKKQHTVYTDFDKVSVDDIRKKAYGTLEDELENNLDTTNEELASEIMLDDEIIDNDGSYEEQPIDIFGELEKKDAIDDLLNQYDFDSNLNDKKNPGSLVEDELNRDYDNYETQLHESYTKNIDDADLFNLIDSMYDKKDGE